MNIHEKGTLLTNEHKKRQKEAQVPTEGGRRELNPRAAGQVFTLRPLIII